jgi:hypothetical protein
LSKSRKLRIGLAALGVAAMAVAVAGPAMATKTVKVPSSLTISAYGYYGNVKSSNPGCLADRTVVLKQKGHGALGRSKSNEKGKWEVSPEDLHFKGPLPYKLFAEVKPLSEGTAGTIYKCGGATSKTIEIAGG